MSAFPVHSLSSAPEKSRAGLQALQAAFGFIPNIAGAIATSPVLIDSLVGLFKQVHGGSFSEQQIQTVLLTNAVANRSVYPVALHTALGLSERLDPADVQAIRAGQLPQDPKLAALSDLARTLIGKRGHLDRDDRERFLAAGFGPDHLLEVVAIVAASTITNYSANITLPLLEQQFQAHAWSDPRS